MENTALRALLHRSRSAAKAVAIPSLLVLGVSATVLLPGQAKAADTLAFYTCTVFGATGGDTNNCPKVDPTAVPGDPLYQVPAPITLGDKKLTFLGSEYSGTIERDVFVQYSWSETSNGGVADQDFSDDFWTFTVGAPTGTSAYSGPFTLTYSYQVDIVSGPLSPLPGVQPPTPGIVCSTPGTTANNCAFVADGDPWVFDAFRVDSNVAAVGSRVTKVVNTLTGAPIELVSIDGDPENKKLVGDYKPVIVTDTVILDSGAQIVSATNQWTQRRTTVPGPLPLLGAGVAFSYSRRLKKRIKAAISA
jgi:hypothetical protein